VGGVGMRFLHLSDFHFAQDRIEDFNLFFRPLLADIHEFHTNVPIDYLMISGDLVDKGGLSFTDRGRCFWFFKDAVIKPIQEALKIETGQIYFVPGNHDVFRDMDDRYQEIGLRQELSSIEKVNDFIDKEGNVVNRIRIYKEFEKDFYQDHSMKNLSYYQSSFISERNSRKVGIACLNSAWRSYDTDTDLHNLLVGERQIIRAAEYLHKADIRVALIHHPVDWLAQFDQFCISTALERNFNLVFCGHIHRNTAWIQTALYNGMFVSIAPANWIYGTRTDSAVFGNGYSIIDFDEDKYVIAVHHRRFSYAKSKYVPNTDLGNDLGVSTFQLPTTTEIEKRKEENRLVSNIKSTHFDALNEHLITYDTDTAAPKDIKSIFVMPQVVEKIEYRGEKKKENEKAFSISEICSFPGSQIIFGSKESGKTILLDRIILEYADNLNLYNQLPVRFDFQEMGNRRIETIINRFLGVSISCVDDLLQTYNIVLLIDNVSFGLYDQKNLNRLEVFLAAHTNVRVIGTCSQIVEGSLPVELFDYPFFASMRKLHIRSFRTQEIRKLVKNWFSLRPTLDQDDKIDKLVRLLLILNLPRTPLAISMFLWIIEQQENYQPINHATMLENFIEKLFLKHSRKEIYSDRFDYRNKERLLSDIAFEMLTKGSENYRLPYRRLNEFVDDYMHAKKFEFTNAEDVLKHFLSNGILIEETDETDRHVRFRFSCFLKYFLMRKMDIDRDFKAHVLDEGNFLAFTDEIDYFTGIKRDADDILELIVSRMEAEFKSILEFINKLPQTFDNIFDTRESFVAKADEAFLTRLTEQKKPTQEEIDQMQNEVLDQMIPEKGITRKEYTISKRKRMELLWTLGAKVLKNTEETTKANLKINSYISVLRCSMAFANLWKYHIEKHIEENKGNPDFKLDQELDIQRQVLPLIHQLYLYFLVGTTKLSIIFREKLEADEDNNNISDFERFITTFIYSDIRGPKSNAYIRKFIKKVRHPHLVDMTLFKLISYYLFRSKTKETDYRYENLIGDLMVNAKKLKKSKKSGIIHDLRLRRIKEKGKVSKRDVKPE
jgi:predicted MPP superfamily phosphohydrolase